LKKTISYELLWVERYCDFMFYPTLG